MSLHLLITTHNKKIENVLFREGVSPEPITWEIDGTVPGVEEWLTTYVEGEPLLPNVLPFHEESLSPFTRRVLDELARVPFGERRTYHDIAVALGNPKAYRAVANGCGRNPWPLFIPCHRIVRSDGGLGGFSAGLGWKRYLIDFENDKRPKRQMTKTTSMT